MDVEKEDFGSADAIGVCAEGETEQAVRRKACEGSS